MVAIASRLKSILPKSVIRTIVRYLKTFDCLIKCLQDSISIYLIVYPIEQHEAEIVYDELVRKVNITNIL